MRIMISILASLLASSALASQDDAKLGRYALSAFQCFAYASNAGYKAEMERFFEIGIEASRKFLEALRADKITREDISKYTPMTVVWAAQGPTIDFAAGRIFESVTRDTYKRMSSYDTGGMLLPMDKWVTDVGLLKSIGENKYRQSNCELIIK